MGWKMLCLIGFHPQRIRKNWDTKDGYDEFCKHCKTWRLRCGTFTIYPTIGALLVFASLASGATPPTQADVQAITKQLQQQNLIQQQILNQQQRSIDEQLRVKNLLTDFPPAGHGGLTPGFLGPTCKAARERMRWSSMPCAWDQPRGYGEKEVDPETNQ